MHIPPAVTTLPSMRWISVILAAAALVLVLGAMRAVLGSGQQAVTEHPVSVPEKPRTVSVSATMPAPSAHARRLSAMLEEGIMPEGPITAEVMTDTDCTPDDRMISRCRNEVRLPDGSMLILRHPHDMRDVPCLAPGEQVRLLPASA